MDEFDEEPTGRPGTRLGWVFALLALVIAGFIAYPLLKPDAALPIDIGNDPLLKTGQGLYQSRCTSCHGPAGRGDGPVAATLGTPSPGDLTDREWKHGDRPEQVVSVIANGVPGTGMSPWRGTLDDAELRAVAAYVYHLAGRDIPAELRAK